MHTRLTLLALMILVFASSCGKEENKRVFSTPEGDVEVTQKEEGKTHEMTFKTNDGTATMKMGPRSVPDDLGVPVYPGVEQAEGGTWSLSGTGEEGEQGFSSTILFSKDSFDKVSAFYKDKLNENSPNIFEMNMPNGKMVNISVEQGEMAAHIVITENKEKQGTHIQITKVKK